MKSIHKLVIIFLTMLVISSCEPRIELELGKWGDKAFITNVELFKLEIDDEAELVEYYMDDQLITGVRKIVISQGLSIIDNENHVATVRLKAGNTLTEAGILLYHSGTFIEPQQNSPKAGIVSDLSAGSFVYRVNSADGSYHDWTINITE